MIIIKAPVEGTMTRTKSTATQERRMLVMDSCWGLLWHDKDSADAEHSKQQVDKGTPA